MDKVIKELLKDGLAEIDSKPFINGLFAERRQMLFELKHGGNYRYSLEVDFPKIVRDQFPKLGFILQKNYSETTLQVVRAVISFMISTNYVDLQDRENNDEILATIAILYSKLIVYLCSGFQLSDEDKPDYKKSNDKSLEIIDVLNDNDNYFYRGQSDCGWGFLPSMYRNFSNRHTTFVITKEEIIEKYRQTDLLKKYKTVFGKDSVMEDDCGSFITFMEYMQHATSYSPLLDVTESVEVASVFASYPNGNHNELLNSDGIVFLIPKAENNVKLETLLDELSIIYVNQKLKPTTIINKKPLFLCAAEDFNPQFITVSEQTNDRMKYQKGHFLFFYKGIIIGNRIMFPPLDSATNVSTNGFKYFVIPKGKDKEDVYETISKNRFHTYEMLMDPYEYFKS